MNHAPNSRLREMTRQGQAPKHFLTTKPPVCKACIYGKMTRHPWRVKWQSSNITNFRKAVLPGDIISVDQLESPEPGFIAQLKGKLTSQWYKVATVFVDHYSSLGFLYLQQPTSAKETIEAKQAFEQFASSQGITIWHYHADNGRFADNTFVEHAGSSGQSLSYCGVGAHHQNGIAE